MVLRLPADDKAKEGPLLDLTHVLMAAKTLQPPTDTPDDDDDDEGDGQEAATRAGGELPSSSSPSHRCWGPVHESMPDWTYLPLPTRITTTITPTSSRPPSGAGDATSGEAGREGGRGGGSTDQGPAH